jgi:hypothetical protein
VFGLSKLRFGRKPKGDELVGQLQARYFPRITREEHEAAKARVAAERAKYMVLRLPDGEQIKMATGVVGWRDITAASGYGVWLSDYDRFGWPKGHPESPAHGC